MRTADCVTFRGILRSVTQRRTSVLDAIRFLNVISYHVTLLCVGTVGLFVRDIRFFGRYPVASIRQLYVDYVFYITESTGKLTILSLLTSI